MIDEIQARFKALALSSEINDGKAIEDDKLELRQLNTKTDNLERNSTIHLPITFEDDLECLLEEMSASLEHERAGFVIEIKKVILQADVLAYRSLNKMSHVIGSKDTNFAALIGKDCSLLRGWKLKSNGQKRGSKTTLSKIEIGGSCSTIMSEVQTILASSLHRSSIQWKQAKYPIFASTTMCTHNSSSGDWMRCSRSRN